MIMLMHVKWAIVSIRTPYIALRSLREHLNLLTQCWYKASYSPQSIILSLTRLVSKKRVHLMPLIHFYHVHVHNTNKLHSIVGVSSLISAHRDGSQPHIVRFPGFCHTEVFYEGIVHVRAANVVEVPKFAEWAHAIDWNQSTTVHFVVLGLVQVISTPKSHPKLHMAVLPRVTI